jgi:hypothetical protein
MPKVTIEFNLPDEQDEYETMQKASKMQMVLWDFSEYLRERRKWGHDYKSGDDALEKIIDKFYEVVTDNNITLN